MFQFVCCRFDNWAALMGESSHLPSFAALLLRRQLIDKVRQ